MNAAPFRRHHLDGEIYLGDERLVGKDGDE